MYKKPFLFLRLKLMTYFRFIFIFVMAMSVLVERKYTCRVSSTLNRDTKQFGKKFMFDNREETCWNSDQVLLFLGA